MWNINYVPTVAICWKTCYVLSQSQTQVNSGYCCKQQSKAYKATILLLHGHILLPMFLFFQSQHSFASNERYHTYLQTCTFPLKSGLQNWDGKLIFLHWNKAGRNRSLEILLQDGCQLQPQAANRRGQVKEAAKNCYQFESDCESVNTCLYFSCLNVPERCLAAILHKCLSMKKPVIEHDCRLKDFSTFYLSKPTHLAYRAMQYARKCGNCFQPHVIDIKQYRESFCTSWRNYVYICFFVQHVLSLNWKGGRGTKLREQFRSMEYFFNLRVHCLYRHF